MAKFKEKNTLINGYRRDNTPQCYLMLSLPIIGFLVFYVYPISWVFRWSFYNYNQIPSYTKFVGWDNFKALFTTDLSYFKSWLTTFEFVLMKVPFEMILVTFISVVLYKSTKFSAFFRTMYFLPHIISTAVVGLIFSNMFSFYGIINGWLLKAGVIEQGVVWFNSKPMAMIILVLASTWQSLGINILYMLAALTNVPKEIYEAAEIDGANRFTEFFKITLPLIAPVFQRILLLALLGTLSTGEFIIVLTNGAPANSTLTVMAYLTKKFLPGFADSATPAIGYGCAMSAITTILFAVIGLTFNRLTTKLADKYD